MIEITDKISINEEELVFRASRSGGPGGQNVNKLNTRITVFFDVAKCPDLNEWQKKKILTRLATRADKNGVIRVVSQKFRTQKANRNFAVERLKKMLAEALKTKPKRKKTKIPYRAKEKRLADKKKRGRLKQQRSEKDFEF